MDHQGAVSLDGSLVLGFAAEGTNISFNFNQSKKEAAEAEARAKASGVRHLAQRLDVRDVDRIRNAAREVEAVVSPIDALINNVGVFPARAVGRTPDILTVPEQLASNEAQRERPERSIPLGELGRRDVVVEAALFLTK